MQLPRVSLVTPCYNTGQYLRKTITSIISQNYDNLEYIIQDGGSSDETPAILSEFLPRLTHCNSAPDRGQYDALNKGFALSSGEIMAWLNADDIYLPATLQLVGKIFTLFPQIKWLTTRHPLVINENDELIGAIVVPGFSKHGFLCGDNLPGSGWETTAFIQQESTFWRRSLWQQAGGYLDANLQFAADFELWARFFQLEELYALDVPLACFRKHSTQKTATDFEKYIEEARMVLAKFGGRVPKPIHQSLRLQFAAISWRPSGNRFKWQKKLFKTSKRVCYSWQEDTWHIEEC